MILVDFSALVFKNIHGLVKSLNPPVVDGKYDAGCMIVPVENYILNDLMDISEEFNDSNIVLCIDDTFSHSWRRDIYPNYKSQRKINRDKTPIPFDQIFPCINELVDVLDRYTDYKIIKVHGAEGDDCILALCDAVRDESIVIYSSDKDMLQMQKYPNVRQYSPILKKFITYKDKADTLNEWLVEHIVLGDDIDGIPKIFSETQFTEEYREFLKSKGISVTEIEYYNLDESARLQLEGEFNGEVWKKIRIGKKTVQKYIKDQTIKSLIESNKLYTDNFRRNKKLILAEFIPDEIKAKCIELYNKSKQPDNVKYTEYLTSHGLDFIVSRSPNLVGCMNPMDLW